MFLDGIVTLSVFKKKQQLWNCDASVKDGLQNQLLLLVFGL